MNRRRPSGSPGWLARTLSSLSAAGAPPQARRGSRADPLNIVRASEAALNAYQLEKAAAMFAHETSQWLKAPGLGALDYSAAISTFIKARQIRRIAATVARQSAADLQALLAGFVP